MLCYPGNQSYAPPSSPPSSPTTPPFDSSPCSSPSLDPLELDDEPPVIHPFAASYGKPRQKGVTGPRDTAITCPRSAKKARYVPNKREEVQSEDDIWAEESELAYRYDVRRRRFELSSRHLTRIDRQFILDLKSMVNFRHLDEGLKQCGTDPEPKTRRFHRTTTEPATVAREFRQTFSRTESSNNNALFSGQGGEDIHFYLANNQISKLPNELWTLENLTTLSLRNNNISYLPPEIANLKNLRDLNISINKLAFLPSELNELSLRTLQVHPNPFREKPDPPAPGLKSVSTPTYLSASTVPSLVEIAFRVLFSPPTPAIKQRFNNVGQALPEMVLDYYLPFAQEVMSAISPPVVQTLNACSPGCIPIERIYAQGDPREQESMHITGVGKCPNPQHLDGPSIFVRHAEERFTWETRIAGLEVGGAVPLRWRGCTRGCLSFLSRQKAEDEGEECAVAEGGPVFEPVSFEPITLDASHVLDFDDD